MEREFFLTGSLMLLAITAGCAREVEGGTGSRFPGFTVTVLSNGSAWPGRVVLRGHQDLEEECEDSVSLNLHSEQAEFSVLLNPNTGEGVVARWGNSFIVRNGERGQMEDGARVEWIATSGGLALEVRGSQWCIATGCIDDEASLSIELIVDGPDRDAAFTMCTSDGELRGPGYDGMCNTLEAGGNTCAALLTL
jgi:hypothetical protein